MMRVGKDQESATCMVTSRAVQESNGNARILVSRRNECRSSSNRGLSGREGLLWLLAAHGIQGSKKLDGAKRLRQTPQFWNPGFRLEKSGRVAVGLVLLAWSRAVGNFVRGACLEHCTLQSANQQAVIGTLHIPRR